MSFNWKENIIQKSNENNSKIISDISSKISGSTRINFICNCGEEGKNKNQ